MNRVLLTGATGFIGAHCLALLLEAGHEVHAVVPEGTDAGDSRARWHVADLLDERRVRELVAEVRPSHLLHLAWFVAPGEYWRSTENMRWLQSGLDLAREFADTGGERSVMAGTCAEYAQSSQPLVEGASPLRPSTLYGACKTALHVSTAAYFAERGVSSAWGHIFYLYGPREHPGRLVPSVIRSLTAGETFVCKQPNDVRDFLHVADVAGAFVAILGSGVEGDVNVASGVPTRVGDLVASIAASVGHAELVRCESASETSSATIGDSSRLRREVGWEPRWSLSEGIDATVDWWRAHPGR